eukprot:9487295-Pyramimonas_sp.AAC.2
MDIFSIPFCDWCAACNVAALIRTRLSVGLDTDIWRPVRVEPQLTADALPKRPMCTPPLKCPAMCRARHGHTAPAKNW